MILLSDNDIIKKLACFDLTGEILAALGVAAADIFVLNTASHVLTSERMRRRMDAASFQRMKAFLATVQIIQTVPNADEMAALIEQPTIDAGEAVLFSVAPQVADSVLATGDKRSLEALACAGATSGGLLQDLNQRLAGRVMSFELILERILLQFGFEAIRGKLIAGRDYDRTTAIILGSALDANEQSFRAGLASYIGDLRLRTGSLLMPSL